MERKDKLTVKGFGKLDGEYPCDVGLMLLVPGQPEYLTYREWHQLKKISDVAAGSIIAALNEGDAAVTLAVAVLILQRAGKTVDVEAMWDAPGTAVLDFAIAPPEKEEGDENLPQEGEPQETQPSDSPLRSGGTSSRPTLVSPATDQSPTGNPSSGNSDSVPATSVI